MINGSYTSTTTALKRSIKLPITFQKLEGDGFHIFTEIKILNDPFFVLVDTGASKTVFSDKLIETYADFEIIEQEENIAAGIGEEKMSARMVNIPLLSLGRAKLNNVHCGIINFENVNNAYTSLGLKTFDGILGGDLLKYLQAEISYKEAFLKIVPL